VFENRVLRRIFRSKNDEVKREWISPNNEELYDLYYLPHIIRLMKSRTMRWVGNLARMDEKRVAYRVLVEKPEEKRQLRKPRRTILRWIFRKWHGWHGLD
jgi:hypothetical protein